jgi:purine-binding chemotaxis protein CheW
MTDPVTTIAGTAAALRREFDRSFAAEPSMDRARSENLLAVRIGGEAYAIRLTEIAGLYADRRIVPLPASVPGFLGLASFRGQVAPVYDLAALLAYVPRPASRWLVLTQQVHAVAFAFDVFEAQLIVSPQHVLGPTGSPDQDAARSHLSGAVHHNDTVRPIVDLPSVVDEIRRHVQSTQHAQTRQRSDRQ